jgi:hypothetical protein
MSVWKCVRVQAVSVVWLLALLAQPLYAQLTEATLKGIVKDASGVLVAAPVTATNESTGQVRSTVTDGNGTLRCLKSLRACGYGICCIDTWRRKGFKWSNEVDTALPTMLCAARTQVVAAHQLLVVPKLSKLQSAGVVRKTPQRVLRIFPRSLSPEASAGRVAGVRLRITRHGPRHRR